jgi:hypothetical protein
MERPDLNAWYKKYKANEIAGGYLPLPKKDYVRIVRTTIEELERLHKEVMSDGKDKT